MKSFGFLNGERLVAMLLMAVVTGGAFWVRSAAVAAEMATAGREQQVERLRQVRDGHRVDGVDLGAFAGLFRGHDVAWERTAAGPCLVLRAAPGGGQ